MANGPDLLGKWQRVQSPVLLSKASYNFTDTWSIFAINELGPSSSLFERLSSGIPSCPVLQVAQVNIVSDVVSLFRSRMISDLESPIDTHNWLCSRRRRRVLLISNGGGERRTKSTRLCFCLSQMELAIDILLFQAVNSLCFPLHSPSSSPVMWRYRCAV